MVHLSDCRGIFISRNPGHAVSILTCFFICTLFSISTASPPPDCSKRMDSLVAAGIQCLDSNDIPGVRHFLAQAFKCGMGKDSMLYFAAELYIRIFKLDTALTFNMSLERRGNFQRELYLNQRARIFRMIGWERQADSLQALTRKKDRYDLSLNTSVSRNILALDPFTLVPQQMLLSIDNDTNDVGNGNASFKWSRNTNLWFKKIFIGVDAKTDAELPTRYSFTNKSDTLVRSVAFYAGAGNLPVAPEGMLGYRLDVHKDGKTANYANVNIAFPIRIKRSIALRSETKWTRGQGIDINRTGLSYTQISLNRKYSHVEIASLGHHFSKTDFYQNRLGSSGIFGTVPLGYVDSLIANQYFRYHRGPNDTARVSIDNFGIDDYWTSQSRLQLVSIPKNDINASLSSIFRVSLPLGMKVSAIESVQGTVYPERLRWRSINPVDPNDADGLKYFNTSYAIVYNAADGKYYLNSRSRDRTFYEGTLKEVSIIDHEKIRIDCYISLSLTIEKEFWKIGSLFFSTTYLKGFSTLTNDDPVVGLNSYGELQAGWKKDFSFAR
jgi:hypothetical protein